MSRDRRFVCIHGHFYQPPRENPWTGKLDLQESAQPYHDWNERIAAECYTPNTAARLLGGDGRLVAKSNNFARISFDFGPTLLSWLQTHSPETYAAILEADHVAHGAMAQAYNHVILPLANHRDRTTQVLWGSRDFLHRFGREPEGMWLPETAVNAPTLDELAAAGLQFTVLAPRQASRVRRFGSTQWRDVTGGRIDPRHAYQVRLPSERRLAVFFYDAAVAEAVAFDGLLHNGEALGGRLLGTLDAHQAAAQLVSVATDGESYGHHHRFGEMALAAAVRFLDTRPDVATANYRSFLTTHPPAHEVEIFDNSSWSCVHGVERWRADCGCNSGAPGWRQHWRAPLRDAFDWLRDQLAPAFQQAAQKYLWDAWSARNDYIEVLLDPAPAVAGSFLARHARRPLAPAEQAEIWRLMEMQRFAMFMYTSCGWFFDDVSGLEAAQNLAYAARAIQLAREGLALRLEPEFLRRLEAVPSNRPDVGTARAVYELQLRRAGAATGLASRRG